MPLFYHKYVNYVLAHSVNYVITLYTKRLGIDTNETRRKRAGFDGIVHFIPGLFNDDLNFRSIEKKTANMIAEQSSGHETSHKADTSELYAEDVQLISKDGKIYYLPTSSATNSFEEEG